MEANILMLVWTVLMAILEVFLLCLAGYILARMDILDKRTRKQVNNLNTAIFTPALLFTKVAFSLTGDHLRELWLIPVIFILATAISAGFAYLLSLLFRVKLEHRYYAMCAAMFMNPTSIAMPLVQGLIGTVAQLKRNEDDTQEAMISRAFTILILFSTFSNIARWSFGIKLIEKADATPSELTEEKNHDIEAQRLPKSSSDVDDSASLSRSYLRSGKTTPGENDQERVTGKKEGAQLSLPEDNPRPLVTSPATSTVTLEVVDADTTLSMKDVSATSSPLSPSPQNTTQPESEPEPQPQPQPPRPIWPTQFQPILKVLKKIWRIFYDLMTMPLWAALLAIIIALIPPIQNLVSNHMTPLRNALETIGDCSIPLTLVVLGGYFHTPPTKGRVVPPLKERLCNVFRFRFRFRWSRSRSKAEEGEGEGEAGRRVHPGERRTMFIAIVSRQVLCPAVVLPLMLIFVRTKTPSIITDPVFIVSNVLVISAPIGLTLAQMSSKNGASDNFERLLSTTIFYAYCITLTPVTIIYIVIALLLVNM